MRRSNQRRDAVFACYQQEVTDRPLSVLLADAKPFTVQLAEGVEEHRAELDEVISEYAKGWDLNRIAPLEKNIMRVALYEMNFRDDVPAEVAIDEAVETAKKFCGAEAPGFVNGILGAAARTMKAEHAGGESDGPGESGTETSDLDATDGDHADSQATGGKPAGASEPRSEPDGRGETSGNCDDLKKESAEPDGSGEALGARGDERKADAA